MPWLTFSAFLVVGLSVVLAAAWAVHDIRNSNENKR
jgi:hypothetical protein